MIVFQKNSSTESWDIKLHDFQPNLAQIDDLPQKGIFLENWLTLILHCFKNIFVMDRDK